MRTLIKVGTIYINASEIVRIIPQSERHCILELTRGQEVAVDKPAEQVARSLDVRILEL